MVTVLTIHLCLFEPQLRACCHRLELIVACHVLSVPYHLSIGKLHELIGHHLSSFLLLDIKSVNHQDIDSLI